MQITPRRPHTRARRYGLAILAVGLALLIKVLVAPFVVGESPFLLLSVAVLASAAFGGLGPAVLATFLGALVGDYFFLSPVGTLVPPDAAHGFRTLFFLGQGLAISAIGAALVSAGQRAEVNALRAEESRESMRASEERYRLLVESVKDYSIFTLDADGNIADWNAGAERLFGYREEEIVGSPFSVIFTPEDIELGVPDEELAQAWLEERGEDERWHLRKDGSRFWASGFVRPVRDSEGELRGFSKVARDITERKRREDSLRFLADAGEELSSSLDYRATLSRVTHLAVPRLADWCAVDIVAEDGSLERLAVAHEDPEKVELARALQERYPMDPEAPYGAPKVLRTGEPELVAEIPDSLLERVARDEGHLEILRRLGLASYMAVPLVARDRVLGTITLVSSEPGRRFGEADLTLAGELAKRAALAVDNSTLYDEARREVEERAKTEERLRFLASLERELQPLTEPDEIMAATALRLGEHLEVDRCAYAEVEADENHFRITGDYTDGVPSIVGNFAMSDFGEEALKLMRQGEPYVVTDTETDERIAADDLTIYRQTRIRAVVCVPLGKAGRFVAGMAIHQQRPRSWSEEEIQLLATVANRCWESIERARTLRSLRQTEERYRAAIEQAGDGVFLFDADTTRILEANPAFQEMLGYTLEELLRMSLYDLVPESPESVDRNVEHTLEYGYFLVGEREYRRRDGSTLEVEVSGNVISFDGQRLVCAVARDITERRRSEEARREAREAERSRIAREMHDTVLQDIVYALQEIQAAPQIHKRLPQRLVDSLEESAGALRGSVEGLREAIFELRLQETATRSMREAVDSLVDLNRRMVRRAYGLELAVEQDFPDQIPAVPAQGILRVIQEALTNARRHASPGHVKVRLGVEEEHVWAEVADDGRGFEPGSRRIGIGSHSMRQRAHEIGGELSMQSSPGRGTLVKLRVPRESLY